MLVAAGVILVGAGSMPLPVVMARFVVRLLISELISAVRSELIKWLVAALALALDLSVAPVPAAEAAKPAAAFQVEMSAS
ncbi:hypothetical protein [Hyphomicrobium sp. D-2]|uniref:hypothetical protein n=1 Tax=Hyphomicrobium sp. D-2 TaxID=3041621 RepID=UPI002453DFA2|nr:hypothetical protein [Hyphomicrobium sp. D-2]MDH4982161.1 hypothetical protein [Hyphomicrobium sp. D-2]